MNAAPWWVTPAVGVLAVLLTYLATRFTGRSSVQVAQVSADEGAFVRAKDIYDGIIDQLQESAAAATKRFEEQLADQRKAFEAELAAQRLKSEEQLAEQRRKSEEQLAEQRRSFEKERALHLARIAELEAEQAPKH